MLPLIAAVLLSAQSGDAPEGVSSREAAESSSACGLGPVSTRYDENILTDVLVGKPQGAPTDKELACVDEAAGYYNVELPQSVQKRFDRIREKRLDRQLTADALNELSANNLADHVPRYQKGVTKDADFARQVEGLCGPGAKGAINTEGTAPTLSDDWVERMLQPPALGQPEFACVLNVSRAAGLDLDSPERH